MTAHVMFSHQTKEDQFVFVVELTEGTQSFRLDYSGSHDECKWMARMFNNAMRRHNVRLRKRYAVESGRK